MRLLYIGRRLRQRHRETIYNMPENISLEPIIDLNKLPPDYKLSNPYMINRGLDINNIIKKTLFFLKIPIIEIINPFRIRKFDAVQLIGHVLLNNKEHYIEIDNVAVLTSYNLSLLYNDFTKFILKKLISRDSCKYLICISEAAKKSVENYFKDDKISNKCVVVYPFSKKRKPVFFKNKKITFLFISNNFYGKGGRETVYAFSKISELYDNVQLILITKTEQIRTKDMNLIKKNEDIKLVEAKILKEDIYNYYLSSDVFITPSYTDSFGLVFLEAISFGLPVISTTMFAIPEMVVNNYNGFLINHPFNYFNEKFLPNPKYWGSNKIVKYVLSTNLDYITDFLFDKMKYFVENKDEIVRMGNNSYHLATTKFSNEKRKNILRSIYFE